MAPSRHKRVLGVVKDRENTPSVNGNSKRSKLKSPSPAGALCHEESSQNVDPVFTPKAKSVLTPRASNASNRLVTPTPRRKTLQLIRLASTDFHGIPPSGLKTLLVSERPPPTPAGSVLPSPASSAYFSHRKRRGKRSGRRFSDLRIPPLSARQFEEAKPQTAALKHQENERTFKEWKAQLKLGHNLLVYGFGSTVELLEAFGESRYCQDGAVLSVKGYKGVTTKEILLSIAKLYFKEDCTKESSQVIMDRMKADGRKMYLIVHSIESESLRSKKDQLLLAKLAACPNVTMVATMRHINGSLLWDAQSSALFGWSMYAVHTCQHYFKEAAHRPIALNPTKESKESEVDEAKMALLVLKSFVPNAQQIFLVLADEERKLAPKTTPLRSVTIPNASEEKTGSGAKPMGVPFGDLYKKCKQRFLVSNTSILRSHLNDLIDHELVEKRKDEKGHDIYSLLLEKETLEKVAKEFRS